MKVLKTITKKGIRYNYLIGKDDDGDIIYNIARANIDPGTINGGYLSAGNVCKLKGFPNLFKDKKRKDNVFLVRFRRAIGINGNTYYTLKDMNTGNYCFVSQDYTTDMLGHLENIMEACPCVKSWNLALQSTDKQSYYAVIESNENNIIEECRKYYK